MIDSKNYADSCTCTVIHEEILNKVRVQMPQDEVLYDIAELFKVLEIQLELKLFVLYLNQKCVCVI